MCSDLHYGLVSQLSPD